MKPLYQFLLGIVLLICVIVIGVLGYTDIHNQLHIVPLRIVQYVIATVSGVLMGNAITRK